MTFVETAVALAVAITSLQVINAAVYKVGDSAGWTTIGNVDYKKWAATKTFQLGDTILFEYHPQFHNVMRVTHAMYRACNASAPLATYTTGNDSITLATRGHHFFLCGIPGHCQLGQKVDISVPRDNSTAPPPAAEPAPPVPGSPNNSAKPLKAFTISPFGNLALVVAVLATFVFGCA